jgi:hypothetical protein
MPYSLEKTSPRCWSVINTDTKEVHAKCTSKKKGQAQIRLLHGIDSGKWKPTKKGGLLDPKWQKKCCKPDPNAKYDPKMIGPCPNGTKYVCKEGGCGGDEKESKIDVIKLDTALFIRLLEWSREDVKADEPLHFATENILKLLSNKEFLTMEDYSSIINKTGGGNTTTFDVFGGGIKKNNIYNKMSWKQFWTEKCKGKKFGSREAINNAMKEAAKEWKSKKGGCTEGAGSEELLLSKGLGKSSANFSVNPPVRKSQCGKRPKVMTQEIIPQEAKTPVGPPPVAGPVAPVGIIATGGKVKKEKVRRTR